MSIFIDSKGNLHDDMNGAAAHLLPADAVKITPAEAELIRNPVPVLDKAQADQIAKLDAAYASAIQAPVSYMTTTFQADEASQSTLTKCLVAGSVPTGFFWLDAANTQVPMTFTQLQGLAAAMLAQGQTAFVRLQMRKTDVRNATTVAAVTAVVW